MLAVKEYFGKIDNADELAGELEKLQKEIDDVAWLIDEESWDVLADNLDTI